ncbi:cell cycle checkpoint control protein RAD9B isoform X2 [Dendrobates tinctorius]|uniref:cell cycle checkpoint control protein RAD9B isoform X2 n=1 Tax=Dendrobates tinctorius TaxID=92724 RepID=UPI003CC9601B
MKCVIPGGHLKVFGKALHSLSRIGDELWFDPLEKGLALRAVSTSRSAYACIFFSSFFFHSYHKAFIHEQGHGNVPLQLKCKFSIKSVLPVFRCLSTLDRNVEKCLIYLYFGSCHMVFQLFFKNGLSKLMHTEIHLGSDEFNDFQINIGSSDVTFCLKEVRGFLSFAEATSAVITIHFHKPGEPIIFSIDDMVFEANFVLATLEEMDNASSEGSVIGSTPVVHKEASVLAERSKENHLANNGPLHTTMPVLITAEKPNQHTTEEPLPTTAYNKFCSLFFGAMSSKQQEKPHQALHTLVTASEDEEEDEEFCRELSQTF